MIDNILKSNDLKITKQRKQILSIINELNDNATIKNNKYVERRWQNR